MSNELIEKNGQEIEVSLKWEERHGLFIISNKMGPPEFIAHLRKRVDRIESVAIEHNGFFQFIVENRGTNEVHTAYIGWADNQSLKNRILWAEDPAYQVLVQSYDGWQLFLLFATAVETAPEEKRKEWFEAIGNGLISAAAPTCNTPGDYPVNRKLVILNSGDCGLLEYKCTSGI